MSSAHLLCLNSGSSSLKFSVFEAGGEASEKAGEGASSGLQEVLSGSAENLGQPSAQFSWKRAGVSEKQTTSKALTDAKSALEAILQLLSAQQLPTPQAVGHRLVHGGPDHFEPEKVTEPLMRSLRDCIPFAPLHLPAELAVVEAIKSLRPQTPQVVCFDTAFHRRLPEVARRLPLPTSAVDNGLHRYGFHGLSCAYIVQHLGRELPERCIIAHLGSGSSLTAVRNGLSVDTTMGLTPTGGVMMGTRSGDLDPGAILYLARQGNNIAALERALNHQSGLLGVSETTADMKKLLELRAHDARAKLAVEMFCYQVRKAIGALTTTLGGLDLLVFAGGVGEHAAPVRAEICQGLAHLGLEISSDFNDRAAPQIQSSTSRVTVRVVETDEDLMIAQATQRLTLNS
jgi:acetate kinase